MPLRLCRDVRPWAVLAALVCLAAPLPAQGTGGPTVSDSRDGYIDAAIPGDQFRLRFDASSDDVRPNRAEFFWAQNSPRGPGVPRPETRVDWQELSAYLEVAPADRLSAFVEVPWRFLNPEVNANHTGLSDLSAGFKCALIDDSDRVVTFQLRTYAPTGDAHLGLGTGHVSLEPALLLWQPLGERAGLEAELRYWVPVGGTDFAGDIIRYGVGFHYDLPRVGKAQVSPVATVVGWTALGGKESVPHPSGPDSVEGVAGQTILSAKLGARLRWGGWSDLFLGYGRPLTGDRWYENTVRVEWRLLY
jgi:hypothetical protein